MRRKMKSIVMLFIILGLIYWRQSAFIEDAYAKEKYGLLDEIEKNTGKYEEDKPENGGERSDGRKKDDEGKSENGGEKSDGRKRGDEGKSENGGEKSDGRKRDEEGKSENGGEKDDEGKSENGEEKDDGGKEDDGKDDGGKEDDGKDDGGKEDNVEEEPSEQIECFQCVIPKGDGKNGYYVSKPEVEISHVSRRGVTRYSFISGSGQKDERTLEQYGDKVRIGKEEFQEGANQLSVWMEDEDGEKIAGYELEKIFLVDTKAPVFKIQTPQGPDTWYQGEVFISVSGEDGEQGSQIEEVVCFQGMQKIGASQKASAGFRISLASVKGKAVPIMVRMSDRAGNCAEETCGLYIDRQPPRTRVEGVDDYMITSRPLEVNYHVEDENAVERMRAGASREDPQGEVTFLEVKDWETTDTGGKASQILEGDGIYRLEVEAVDKSGYGDKSTRQVIIDSESPVIQSVDEMDGQYVKSFCWDLPVKEVIKDFTSYTYSIYLDGKTYHMGENVTSEGNHVLEVKAVDAAGNEGTARADFVIDRTAPTVVFKDIEEGAEYKKEKSFEISLKNPEDHIREIAINGEKQEIDSRSKTYQYYVNKCKNYEISVKAYDQAGNQTVSRMNFKVAREETLLHKVADPILKALAWPSQEERKEQTLYESEWKERRTFPAVFFLVIGIMTATGTVTYAALRFYKRSAD